MTDPSMTVHRLREQLREEYADIMLVALREKAGVFLTADEYYRAKEKLMDALSGLTTV